MPRVLWKGGINFGLVHIPVALYPAAKHGGIDFDWLDKRSMKPVGYKRVNKESGEEVQKEDIVRGYEHEDGRYVVLTDEEIRSANKKATQSVDILAFVDAADISVIYWDTPYYLAPIQRGEKVYALLRETLRQTKKIGIANVVIQTKQHLAALAPMGPALLLNTLRWHGELRSIDEIELPSTNLKSLGLRDKEMAMAAQLVKEMSEKWKPEQYRDNFREDIMAMIDKKIKTGETEVVTMPASGDSEPAASNIIDLSQLLKRSLQGGGRQRSAATGTKKKSATRLNFPAQPARRKS